MTELTNAAESDGLAGLSRGNPSDWLRLHTLILVRWMAITGQLAAILVATLYYGIALDLGLCLMVVGIAVIANLVAAFIYPETKRLSEGEATLVLLFDAMQLAVLLALTGGLTNPFALLMLAPPTVAATALSTRPTTIVAGATIGLATLVTFAHLPLRTVAGAVLEVPAIFEFGFWLAIVIGVVFLGLYARRVASEVRAMNTALLATQLALAREQRLSDLGGVVAAAAHELGTPLATIKLVSAELAEELADRPELLADANLIRAQADRCRDILRSMGRAGKDDLHLKSAPLLSVVREAAEPHAARGKVLHLEAVAAPGADPRQPAIRRRPEIIHGIRNLVQNAVDFAQGHVWITAGWTDSRITLRVADDGPGYPQHLIGRIGDPFMRHRPDPLPPDRPGYEGMGLGLFIAKTLLQRTGAELSFANGTDPFLTESERPEQSGAIVLVSWPRSAIEAAPSAPLGANQPHVG